MSGLGAFPAGAVLRADDLERATRFYVDVLGLSERPGGPGATMFEAGQGTLVTVYERPGMPAPENTTLGIAVPQDQFDSIMDELRGKGVVFEDYDIPEIGLKTENGVATMDGVESSVVQGHRGQHHQPRDHVAALAGGELELGSRARAPARCRYGCSAC